MFPALRRKLDGAKYIVKKFYFSSKASIITAIYGPRAVGKAANLPKVRLVTIEEEQGNYYVAIVKNGSIFTNRINNISVISTRLLVPLVSWQWHDRELRMVPDEQNALLTKQLLLTQAPKYVDSVVVSLLTGTPGNDNYYHWFFDCLSRLFLANKVTKPYQNIRYLIPDDLFAYQKETLAQLGIDPSSYITSRDASFIQSKLLIVSSYPNPDLNNPAEWSIDFLKKSFIHLALQTENKNQLIYISRGDSLRSRRLTNENYLLSLLVPLGFRVVHLAKINFIDQVTLFANAKMVVGVHGAGFTNIVFSKPGTIVCEIFGDIYQPIIFKKISNYLDLEYNAYFSIRDQNLREPPEDANEMWRHNNATADISISDKNIQDIVNKAKDSLQSLKASQ